MTAEIDDRHDVDGCKKAYRHGGEWVVGVAAIVFAAVLFAVARSGLLAQTDGGAPKSVWEGVYTKAQAERGETLYQQECTRCHNQGPMTGVTFMSIWNGRTAEDLYQMMKNTMPQDGPGRFTRREYIDMVAFTFKANEFPSGEIELKTEPEKLQAIRIEPKTGSK